MFILDVLKIPDLLTNLVKSVDLILSRVTKMSVELDRLREEVAETKTITASAIALIAGLVEKLRASASLEEVMQLADDLDAQNALLAEAIALNSAE